MARNPLTVGGIKGLIDKVGDEVSQAARKAAQDRRKGERFNASGHITVNGQFGFNQEGEFGLVGNVVSNVIDEVVGGELTGDLNKDWNSIGDGTLELHFEISVDRAGDGVE